MKKLSWRAVNKQLLNFTEDQLQSMIEEELRTHKRVSVLERMHQRYNILRMSREREELLTKAASLQARSV